MPGLGSRKEQAISAHMHPVPLVYESLIFKQGLSTGVGGAHYVFVGVHADRSSDSIIFYTLLL